MGMWPLIHHFEGHSPRQTENDDKNIFMIPFLCSQLPFDIYLCERANGVPKRLLCLLIKQ